MNNHQDHLHDLWRKFVNKQATAQEVNELFQLLENASNDELSQSFLQQYFAEPIAGETPGDEYWLSKLDEIKNAAVKAPIVPIHRKHLWSRGFIRYAAAVIILVGIGTYLYTALIKNQTTIPTTSQPDLAKNDVLPGRQGAILTLSTGKTVVLDSLGNGIVANEAGTQVVLENGNLSYNSSNAGEVSYNTMSTPKGRQFLLLLPDGTKVWLNAASSITYPTAFIGKERNVKITGEAYFEVAKNPEQPFKVSINDAAEIEVLGTHFNVNAYANETDIKTTLLEGSVRIKASRNQQTMAPGQQTQIKHDGNISTTYAADLAQAVAWKDGVFNFDGAGLKEVMNQLERWYDIDVVYEKNIPSIRFFGKISRQASLASVLKGLADAKVNFRIEEGKRLIVTP